MRLLKLLLMNGTVEGNLAVPKLLQKDTMIAFANQGTRTAPKGDAL